jgi:XrtN system VIT domain protein
MKPDKKTPYNGPYLLGLALQVISMAIYLLSENDETNGSPFSQSFFLNFAISVLYLFMLPIFKVSLESPRTPISYGCWINVVLLFTISAFALNKQMRVFAEFPQWLNIYTLLSLPLFLTFPYYSHLPAFLRSFIMLLSGASLVISVYTFFYLLPLFPLSVIALVALGISVHTFVPAFWLIILLYFIWVHAKETKQKVFIAAGALVPLAILSVYLFKWRSLQDEIREVIAEQNVKLSNMLPDDIYLAQRLPSDVLTDEILVAPLKAQRFWNDGFGFNREGATKYHNPLATIAMGMFGEVKLSEESVVNILNIRKDQRHQNKEKLWSGTSLSTMAVSTNIRVQPEYRLAYHEKTIVIHNDGKIRNNRTWFRSVTQEALFTFHLPEGGLVTSFSLWIDGKEERSRLTTMQKADSAYKTIVGVERRDPAIVHWQEGNRVTVNVFPCTSREDRKFKIGFTTPLCVKNESLILENIWFEGPDQRDAMEVTQILSDEGTTFDKAQLGGFDQQPNGTLMYKGDYRSDWKLSIKKPELSAEKFVFGGFSYRLSELKTFTAHQDVKNVYIDLNAHWSKKDFKNLVEKFHSKTLYAWTPEKTRLTNDNADLIWENATKNQFSFPFLYDIHHPESSVLITHSTDRSPLLSDVKGSDVANSFTKYFSDGVRPVQVLDLGDEISPFMRSLRELRLIRHQFCTSDEALEQTRTGNFEVPNEDSSHVVIADSHLTIVRDTSSDRLTSSVPEHLLREFAYNDLLRKIGPLYFEKEKYEDVMFRQAEEAYIVTPLTSMVVLESAKDYDRMGINENKDTVGNASVLGGGAVPEPHEWLLIALVLFFILHYLYKKYRFAWKF